MLWTGVGFKPCDDAVEINHAIREDDGAPVAAMPSDLFELRFVTSTMSPGYHQKVTHHEHQATI